MTGVEIDFVVADSLTALELYESIFEVQRVEVTSYDKGMNEAVFTMYGTRFHMLDENPEYQLVAPRPGDPKPMWLNVLVPDIRATWDKAMKAGCTQVQPVTEMEAMGGINAMFTDPFGYIWMLHEIVREVSFEERCRIMEEQMKQAAAPVAFCQSCGMPFDEGHRELIAKERDGGDSEYCVYCYKDGAFLNPEATIADMVEMGVPHLARKMGEEAAREQLTAFLPTLKRWLSDKE